MLCPWNKTCFNYPSSKNMQIVSKWHPKILQRHPKFWKPRYGFALHWSKTIWFSRTWLWQQMAAMLLADTIFRARKLEAKVVSLVSVQCHAHRLATASCILNLLQLCKCFTVSPLRSACLAMHQTTVKTKGRQLHRACKTRWLSSEATVRARGDFGYLGRIEAAVRK